MSTTDNKKVLLIGATGFIGHEAAIILRQQNFIVYGLARSTEKAQLLLKDEIIPILHTTSDMNYLDSIVTLNITHVIDLSGTPTSTPQIAQKLVAIKTSTGYQVGFIYISGAWVHGNDNVNTVDEHHFAKDGQVKPLVSWRPALEQQLLSYKDDLPTIIVRPGLLYGKNSPILAVFFSQVVQAVIKNDSTDINLPINKDLVTSWIHVTDLGRFLTKVIQKFELYNSSTFDLPIFDVTHESFSAPEFVTQSAKDLGFKGNINFLGEPTAEENIFLNGFNTSIIVNNKRARALLDWEPTLDLKHHTDFYIKPWAAANNKEYIEYYLAQ
ncbi:hypothetical protein DFJ63DRAFT_122712 [Scheffersomyces coipomensis]|uniref:uncharacterized protein n=1 Tax=Scheffersomyces coipomensis TaxID=1788519 RepID=UPI00315D8A27